MTAREEPDPVADALPSRAAARPASVSPEPSPALPAAPAAPELLEHVLDAVQSL